MATVASACNNNNVNFAGRFDQDNNIGDNLRDASFSSYLGSGHQEITFINPKLLEDPTRTTPPPPAVSAADPPHQLSLGKKYININDQEGELGIFSAEKYFSGRMDREMDQTPPVAEKGRKQQQPIKEASRIDLPRPKKNFKSSTPSTCSEASSWNSRSAFLQKAEYPSPILQRQMSSGTTATTANNFFSSFGCNCAGKKSINDIDERPRVGSKNTNSSSHCRKIFDMREEPIFIQEPAAVVGQMRAATNLSGNKQNLLESRRRGKDETNGAAANDKGINVGNFKREESCFAFPVHVNPAMGNDLNTVLHDQLVVEKARASLDVFGSPHMMKDRRLSAALNLKAGPRRMIKNAQAISGAMDGDNDDDDVGSESSSDLFEIESLSTKVHNQFLHSDHAASFKTTTTTTTTNTVLGGKEAQRRQHPSILLSCKSAKAVNVVANAHCRVPEKFEPGRQRTLQSDFVARPPLGRFQQAEN